MSVHETSQTSVTPVIRYESRGNLDFILIPKSMPREYSTSVDYLTRLLLAAGDPMTADDAILLPMDKERADRLKLSEGFRGADAVRNGRSYENRYDAATRLAEMAIATYYPEIAPESQVPTGETLATVIEFPAAIPAPRREDDQVFAQA